MYNVSVIIPARSGSKGIKDKNIKELNGKPLISYTIEEAKKCRYVDNIYVSTDSKIYAGIAQKYGAKVPFLRSKKLSEDDVHSVYPVVDLVEKLKKTDYKNISGRINIVVMLLPTSPLRKFWHIDKCIELFMQNMNDVYSVISVSKCKNPMYIKTINNDRLIPYEYKSERNPNIQRQDFKKTYSSNGSIYVTRLETLISEKTFYTPIIYPYVMDKLYSVDIDDMFDFKMAELILKGRENNEL